MKNVQKCNLADHDKKMDFLKQLYTTTATTAPQAQGGVIHEITDPNANGRQRSHGAHTISPGTAYGTGSDIPRAK